MTMIGDLYETKGEATIEWKIKNFYSLSQESNMCYHSPKFYFSGESWELWMYPNGESEYESEGWIDLYLMRMSSGSSLILNFSLGLKNMDSKTAQCMSYIAVFQKKRDGWGKDKFISRLNLKEKKSVLTPSGTLTIVCTLKNSQSYAVAKSLFSQHQQIVENLKETFEEGKRTDIVLKVEGQNIPAHKLILETRSPVFAAMFRYDTKENQTGEVSIDDVDKSTMEAILLHMYSGEIDNLTKENVLSLYGAAEKYDIKTVKLICSEFITKHLSIDWVCDVIKFAEMYRDEEISQRSRDYFKEHVRKILNTENWKKFAENNPDISIELLGSVIEDRVPDQIPPPDLVGAVGDVRRRK